MRTPPLCVVLCVSGSQLTTFAHERIVQEELGRRVGVAGSHDPDLPYCTGRKTQSRDVPGFCVYILLRFAPLAAGAAGRSGAARRVGDGSGEGSGGAEAECECDGGGGDGGEP